MSKSLIKLFIIIWIGSSFCLSQTSEEISNYFITHSTEFNIPIDILKAVAYTETRFYHTIPGKEHQSCSGLPHSYGMMGLRNDAWFGTSLLKAAELIQENPDSLISNFNLNIKGASALLSSMADELKINRENLNEWKPVLEKYSGIPQDDVKEFYSFDAFKVLSEGTSTNGIEISVHPEIDIGVFGENVNPKNKLQNLESVDYPPAVWDPSPNFYSNPPFYQKFSVVHTTQGNFAGSVSWLKNPASSAATHYIIRSSDGYVVQLVREANAAWHAVCWNRWMFGTEHEGFIEDPSWYTDTMYLSSAALFRHLCVRYSIPMTRNHVIGHGEKSNTAWVSWMQQNFPSIDPNCNSHTDPGQYWDWNFYMQLITQDTLSPKVLTHIPTGTDSAWSNTKIKLTFNQRMRKPETQNAFSIQPSVQGIFNWEDLGKTLVFTPSTLLDLGTQYTITLSTNAKNFNYRPILGNYSFSFVTKTISSLNVLTSYPVNNQQSISSTVKVIMNFNNPLLQSSISENILFQTEAGVPVLMKNLIYSEINGKGTISFSPLNKLSEESNYKVIIKGQLKNIVGVELGNDYVINFKTEKNNFILGTVFDSLETIGNWQDPNYSGSTVGTDPSLTTFTITSDEKVDGSKSGKINYVFTGQSGVCRTFNGSKPNIGSNPEYKMGLWVYGDLSNNYLEFWFYYNAATNVILKIDTLDWTGWKFIEIPISSIPGSGDRLFHSVVIRQAQNGVASSAIYIDGAQYRDPSVTVQLTAMIEGFYNGSTMIPDTVTVELHNTSAPYDLVEQKKILLNSSGQGSGIFTSVIESSLYYVVLKHRNSIETWSASGRPFSGKILSYDFTTAANKAYGNNLKLKGTKWCMYGGDVNKDGFIDLHDLIQIDNDSFNNLSGYRLTDLNGDNLINSNDMIIGDTNARNFITKNSP